MLFVNVEFSIYNRFPADSTACAAVFPENLELVMYKSLLSPKLLIFEENMIDLPKLFSKVQLSIVVTLPRSNALLFPLKRELRIVTLITTFWPVPWVYITDASLPVLYENLESLIKTLADLDAICINPPLAPE